MAKVPLRTYNRDIESMTANGHLDEAVAHCQHILKTFSLHVETYQLLGKAFLEARRYTDAADIFQRILMAVPDDFVSHVGMSIIRDDEGRLDESIWHMERAFEVQPSNPAIQGELRRLYGRRDGVEPPKIRLTRDALANMYSQGELFNQAIGEINAVLAEDPNRPDLQLMLARAYFKAGQKVQATEISAGLLRKYPYCMDALRILVDILPGTSKTDRIQTYRNRLVMLDPYAAFVTGSAFSSDQVPEGSVSLERLDYKPGASPLEAQPNWAASLGIKLEDGKSAGESPDWFSKAPKPPDGSNVEAAPASEPVPAASGEDIPEWMRTAGWQTATGAAVEGPSDLAEEAPAEKLGPSEIPDWVKSLAPEENRQAAASIPAEGQETGFPDWLTGMIPEDASASEPNTQPEPALSSPGFPDGLAVGGAGKPPEEIPGPQPAASSSGLPDWLAAGGAGKPPEEIPGPEPASSASGLPDWLAAGQAGKPPEEIREPEPASSSSGLPDWLAAGEAGKPTEETVSPQPELSSQDVPDWLAARGAGKPLEKSKSPGTAKPAVAPVSAPKGGAPRFNTESEDDIPDWLSGLGAGIEVEQPASPAKFEDTMPTIPSPPSALPAEKQIVEDETDTTEADAFVPSGKTRPLNIEDDTFGWLEGLAAKQGAKPDELLTKSEDRNQELPEWLKPALDGAAAVLPTVEPGPALTEPLPAEQAPFIPTGPVKPVNIEDTTMAWLEGLAANQGAKPEELLTNSEDRNQGMPEWLKPAVDGAGVIPPAKEPGVAQTEPFPAEQAPFNPIGPVSPLITEKDSMAWPEGLASQPAVKPESKPQRELESIPEWMDFGELNIPTPDPPAASTHSPGQEKALAPQGASGPTQAGSEKPSSDDDATITSWLKKMAKDEIKQAAIKANEEKAGIVPATTAPPAGELPDWLQDLDQSSPPAPAQEGGALAQKLEPVQEPPAASVETPEWLKQPVQPSAKGSPSIPGPEQLSEPEQASWVDENIPALDALIPTHPEEWQPVGEISPPSKPAEQEPVPAKKEQRPVTHTGALASVPPQDKDANILREAQTQLEGDHLDESMKVYVKLIKKGRLLEEVIHDLQEAIYRHPVDVIIWQTLGDALMRANRLQDALDAYTKAEELLR